MLCGGLGDIWRRLGGMLLDMFGMWEGVEMIQGHVLEEKTHVPSNQQTHQSPVNPINQHSDPVKRIPG